MQKPKYPSKYVHWYIFCWQAENIVSIRSHQIDGSIPADLKPEKNMRQPRIQWSIQLDVSEIEIVLVLFRLYMVMFCIALACLSFRFWLNVGTVASSGQSTLIHSRMTIKKSCSYRNSVCIWWLWMCCQTIKIRYTDRETMVMVWHFFRFVFFVEFCAYSRCVKCSILEIFYCVDYLDLAEQNEGV